MRKVAAVVLFSTLLSAVAGAAPLAPGEAFVLLNGLPLWQESGGVLTRMEALVIGDTVALLNRAATFTQDGQKREFVRARAPDGREGWVRTPYLAAKSTLAVVRVDKATIYGEPRDVKITTRHISGMTVVAVPADGRGAPFARVKGYDRVQKILLADDTWVKVDDLATADDDVNAAVLFTVAMEKPDVRARLLDTAIKGYPRSLFLAALQVAQGGAAAVGKKTVPGFGSLWVTVDGVNVRSAPDEVRGTVIDRLNKGTQVQVTEMTARAYSVAGTVAAWFHLRNPDGWMFGAFLQEASGMLAEVPPETATSAEESTEAGAGSAQSATAPPQEPQPGVQVSIDQRLLTALVRIDLHLLMDYDFSTEKWPTLGVVQWPLTGDYFPASQMKSSWAAVEGALNHKDIASAVREAGKFAGLAEKLGLHAGATDIARLVKQYADRTGDSAASSQMGQLILLAKDRLSDSPEFSAAGVAQWMLALKPGTLFVGDLPDVRVLGLVEIQNRFANMLEILAQDMASPVNLTACPSHPDTPDHLVRDFWVMVQRLRLDTARLKFEIEKGDLEPVVQAVPYFNGSWGLAREMAQGSGCSVVGPYATWK
jgi:hypothetical protein